MAPAAKVAGPGVYFEDPNTADRPQLQLSSGFLSEMIEKYPNKVKFYNTKSLKPIISFLQILYQVTFI